MRHQRDEGELCFFRVSAEEHGNDVNAEVVSPLNPGTCLHIDIGHGEENDAGGVEEHEPCAVLAVLPFLALHDRTADGAVDQAYRTGQGGHQTQEGRGHADHVGKEVVIEGVVDAVGHGGDHAAATKRPFLCFT